tara:strand:+ start:9168 stop:9788 length:621 start_codon:yes stop_codon:yes gene_type:complete
MAITNGYITLAQLKTYLGLSGSGQDSNLENAVEAASREIDAICGRFFYQSSSDTKYFTPDNALYLNVPDISSPSGLSVLIDTSDDGTHDTTLTIDTDFFTKPLNAGNDIGGVQYQPITQITILDTRSSERFDPTIVKQVKVTCQWGWSAVPQAIEQATYLQATRLWKRKDSPFSVYGSPETGTAELFNKFDPDAMKLIKGYIKRTL